MEIQIMIHASGKLIEWRERKNNCVWLIKISFNGIVRLVQYFIRSYLYIIILDFMSVKKSYKFISVVLKLNL